MHKVLEKEPTHRYATASEFAADLQRWLKGEPIEARPVSQAERFRRWCKRNPCGLTAGGIAAAGLLIATITSIGFALQYRARAAAETKQKEAAQVAEHNMEGLLARGLAKPLDPDADSEKTLSTPEAESLWELARQADTNLGLRFLDEAASDPIALNQLKARSEPATVAAVGTDEVKRNEAIRRLEPLLESAVAGRKAVGNAGTDHRRSPMEKAELAFVLLELSDRPGLLTEACANTISEAMGSAAFQQVRNRWFIISAEGSDGPMLYGKVKA